MASTNGQPQGRYSLSTAGPAKDQLLAIVDAAIAAGTADNVVMVLKSIRERLRRDPGEFGEPLYHIAALKMTVRCAVVSPLYVEYGLHDVQPVAIIRRFAALSAND